MNVGTGDGVDVLVSSGVGVNVGVRVLADAGAGVNVGVGALVGVGMAVAAGSGVGALVEGRDSGDLPKSSEHPANTPNSMIDQRTNRPA